MPSYVLDTSAILTILHEEPGTQTVLNLLEDARSKSVIIYLPFMTLMELEYQSLRRFGPGETQRVLNLVGAWPVEIEHSTEGWCHEAAAIKATAPVSVADAWICGLARWLDAELVHKDPEYDAVPDLQALRLPYKHQAGDQ
jgi:predicted nucleic acid-binding protein